jgi:hypothetical protein
MKLKKSFWPLALFCAFTLIGCFEYEETIKIHKDGSGEMAVHYFGPENSDFNLDGFKLSAKDERGIWKDKDQDGDDEDNGFGQWVKEKIADELEDHIKLRFVIETDGDIIETNARDRMPHRAVWRFDGGDLLKPEGLDMKLVWK